MIRTTDGHEIGLVADTVQDKNNLKNGVVSYDVPANSTCLCIEDSSVMMLTSTGEWKEI